MSRRSSFTHPIRHFRQPTANRMGWTSNQLNTISRRFVEDCARPGSVALDIGAAFGIATLPALAAGAHVFANDLDPSHLHRLRDATPPADLPRLTLLPGRFPRALRLPEASLTAVHASNVFHFLTGRQMELGLASCFHWLRPGGRFFLQVATPFQSPFERFLPLYAQRLAANDPWPGWIANVRDISDHGQLSQLPKSIHLLDLPIAERAFLHAGFAIEEAFLYRRHDLPASLFLDGRESLGLIAQKPD